MEQVSHRRRDTGAVVLATKIRLENGNGNKKQGKLKIGAIFLASNKK